MGILLMLALLQPFVTPAEEREPVSFTRTIRPILREKCIHCHNRKTLPDRPARPGQLRVEKE